MTWDHDYKFQCVECKCEATLSRAPDGSLEQLVCQNTNCLYEDTPYDKNAILHVMLEASSLASYHQEIRQKLNERQAPRLMHPYLFRLIPCATEHRRVACRARHERL